MKVKRFLEDVEYTRKYKTWNSEILEDFLIDLDILLYSVKEYFSDSDIEDVKSRFKLMVRKAGGGVDEYSVIKIYFSDPYSDYNYFNATCESFSNTNRKFDFRFTKEECEDLTRYISNPELYKEPKKYNL